MNVNLSPEDFHASTTGKSLSRRSLLSLRNFPKQSHAWISQTIFCQHEIASKVCLLELTSASNWIISRRCCNKASKLRVHAPNCSERRASANTHEAPDSRGIFIFGNVMNQLKQLNADWYAANLALMCFIIPMFVNRNFLNKNECLDLQEIYGLRRLCNKFRKLLYLLIIKSFSTAMINVRERMN